MLRYLPILAVLALLLPGGAGARVAHGQGTGEPVFVVHEQPAIPLVALRMALLVDDPSGLAGAGHLIQHLHYSSLQARARSIGAKVQMERTSDAIVYTITGPAVELDHLASLLRSVLQPPSAGAGARLAAERDLAEERLAEWETAERHVRATLRGRLFPADLSAAGTTSSARRLSAEALDNLWWSIYDPGRIAILAVGDVTMEGVQRAFGDLPAAREVDLPAAARDTAALVPLAPAEATRAWFGVGYLADDLPPAAVSATSRLLHDLLQSELPASEVTGEHWWTHHGQALALLVAAPPSERPEVPRQLATALDTLRERLTDERVAAAGRAIRHDMLFYSRTPDRMAEVIGRFVDRGGDPEAAQRFYAELSEVDAEDVRAVLDALAGGPAVQVDVPPQVLNTSR